MNKVQLSLTEEEVNILSDYGSQFGYSLPKTIRYVISKAAEEFLSQSKVSVFEMSEKRERSGLRAIEKFEAGETKSVSNTDAFFDNL